MGQESVILWSRISSCGGHNGIIVNMIIVEIVVIISVLLAHAPLELSEGWQRHNFDIGSFGPDDRNPNGTI